MTKIRGFLLGQHLPQLLLHLHRVLTLGQTQFIGNPDAMGVADHGGLMVNISQQQIGRFPAHAGQLQKVVHIVRHFPVKVAAEHLTGQHNVTGLMAVETAGPDIFLHFGNVRVGEIVQGGEPLKQRRGDQIHPRVGTLGRQPHGNHQFIILLIVQCTQGIGVGDFQCFDDASHPFIHSHGKFLIFYQWFFTIIPQVSTGGKIAFFGRQGYNI